MSLPTSPTHFMVVDDDDRLRERMVRALQDRGHEACGAAGPREALRMLDACQPQRAVIDLRMPGGNGLDLLAQLLKRLPDLEVVMLTGYGSIATAVEAVKRGAVNYLAKPADVDMILAAFEAQSEANVDYEPPSLARAEWEHIQRVLEDCDGNVSQAARKLGLHRRTLQRKLQKYPPRS